MEIFFWRISFIYIYIYIHPLENDHISPTSRHFWVDDFLNFPFGGICDRYPSSHNHGSVENGCISNINFLSLRAIFHLHDYGRKGIYSPEN